EREVDPPRRPVATPVSEQGRGEAAIADRADMCAPVAEPGNRVRVLEHLPDGVEVPAGEVEGGQIEQGGSVADDDQVVGELDRFATGATGARCDRVEGIGLVVGRIA